VTMAICSMHWIGAHSQSSSIHCMPWDLFDRKTLTHTYLFQFLCFSLSLYRPIILFQSHPRHFWIAIPLTFSSTDLFLHQSLLGRLELWLYNICVRRTHYNINQGKHMDRIPPLWSTCPHLLSFKQCEGKLVL
jgi:hypothetical protein